MQKNPAPPAGAAQQVDVGSIIARVQQDIPANLQAIYNKAVLSGMRIMFDPQSHQMMQQQLDGPGPLAKKLSDGIIQLMYMLWTQSNKTLPPQIIVPVALTLTLKAYDFLQQSHDPQATKQALGDATEQVVQGIIARFQPNGGQPGAAPAQPAAPQPGGMLDAAGGQ